MRKSQQQLERVEDQTEEEQGQEWAAWEALSSRCPADKCRDYMEAEGKEQEKEISKKH